MEEELRKLVPEGDMCIDSRGKTCPLYQNVAVKDEDSERGIKSPIEVPSCLYCQRGDVTLLLESEIDRLKLLYGVEDLTTIDFFSSTGLSQHIKECDENL